MNMRANKITEKEAARYEWFVLVNYGGFSNSVYREVGEIVSRHHTNEAAQKSARRSDKWQIAHVSDITT